MEGISVKLRETKLLKELGTCAIGLIKASILAPDLASVPLGSTNVLVLRFK